MRTLRIGRIVVAGLLLSGCGPKLPTLTERGDEAARTAIRQANERIGAAKAPGSVSATARSSNGANGSSGSSTAFVPPPSMNRAAPT